ncbi:MAG: class I SAM-dependent methyltransferase [Phycisphaeraceae bacterium]|nr:class I SAM-dependent methyltransferase [Phycisphaeraceae bacterium]
MKLTDVIQRKVPPTPWEEGDNIPWHDAAFSTRMLREHLSQDHDLASRRATKIDEQVQWIHEHVLQSAPTKILDLACGPGLYTTHLAKLGHTCVGIDYSPASIAHAKKCAADEHLACEYLLQDVREAEYGDEFGLVMMIFGQFNVFSRGDARHILGKAFAALRIGGRLLLEPQKYATVKDNGLASASWSSHATGLFSDEPHLCLTEHFWDETSKTSTQRFFIVETSTGAVTRYAMSNEAYSDEQYLPVLIDAGFENIEFFPSLIGVEDDTQSANLVIMARQPTPPGAL